MRVPRNLLTRLSSIDLKVQLSALSRRYRSTGISTWPSRAQRRVLSAIHLLAGYFKPTIVTVDFDSGFARMVALKGREVVGWGTTIVGDVDDPEDGLDGQMAPLLDELRSGRDRLISSFPLHTTLARRLVLPFIARKYRKLVVESEIAETIPFSQDEVDLAWSAGDLGADQEIFATAVKREVMDRHVAGLARLDHPPASVYSRATALAAASGLDDAVVVDLGITSADLVLVRGGVPRVVHSSDLPDSGSGAQSWEAAIERAITRVTGHDESLDGDGFLERLPVVFTGPLAEDYLLSEKLALGSGRAAVEASSGFEYPSHFPAREYAVNLGLARADLKKRSVRAKLARKGSVVADMLPERHRLRGLPIIPASAFIILLLLGLASFGVAAQVDSASAEGTRLAVRVAALERQERMRKLDLGASSHAKTSLQDAQQLVSSTERSLVAVGDEADELMLRIATLTSDALTADVELTSVVQESDTFRVGGTALGYDALLQYSDTLLATGVYSQVNLLELRSGSKDGASISFQMQALTYPTLRAMALSEDE